MTTPAHHREADERGPKPPHPQAPHSEALRPEADQLTGDRPAPTQPVAPSALQRLQSAAGNRAVTALLAQRRAAASRRPGLPAKAGSPGPVTAPESAAGQPATGQLGGGQVGVGESTGAAGLPVQRLATGDRGRPSSAGADPKFAALKADVRGKQKLLSAHPPASTEASQAQGAARPPQDDIQAQGKAANAEKMNAAKPDGFDKAAFIKAVNDAIAQQAPKNLDEADKFADSGKAEAVKGEVQGQVSAGKKISAAQIETATKAPPDTAAAKEKTVTPLQPDHPPGTPATPDPAKAVPDKAPPSAIDFSAGPKQVDDQMQQAEVTEDQLKKSNEPEFTDALAAKKEGEQHAATAPGQVRGKEAAILAGAKAQATQASTGAMTALAGDRRQAGAQVQQGKEGAKGSDESKRAQVTATLQKVFDATQKDVEDILSGLDKKVDDSFSAGEKAARDAFTAEHKRKMDAYKDARYSGWTGKLRWVKDKFTGLPAEANQIFVQARQGYVTRMQGVISQVADVIGVELGRAKQRIAAGRDQLQAEVKKLPADLQAIGKQAAGEFSGKFDGLTESVDAKGSELINTLATKYNDALKSVDDEIAAEREKNEGLVAKAVNAVKGVIDTILKLKDLLLGVLAKAASAVAAIIKDPIGFLGHLVSAVGAGLKSFLANIGEHLKKGLIGWLMGNLANAGIQLPDKFDLRGILMMIAGLLGLTWNAIRGRIVSRGVPDQAMAAVEQSVPLAQKIQAGGIAGVWEEIKEKIGDLKENLFGKISEYLIPTVLVAGITWIISLLNPASAFIKACKMIIDIVTFILDRGAQIIAFVNSVLDAIIAIAKGGAGGVPALIEDALAKSIPVLIGALAAILGVSGIADKIKSFIQSLSKPVMKAVDWVVGKIVGFGKKIWAKLKAKFGKGAKDGKPDAKAVSTDARKAVDNLGHGPLEQAEVETALGPVRGTYQGATITPGLSDGTWNVHVQLASADGRTGAFSVPGAYDEIYRSLKTVRARAMLDQLRDKGGEPYVRTLKALLPASADQREAMLAKGYGDYTDPKKYGLKIDKMARRRQKYEVAVVHALAEEGKRSHLEQCAAARQSFEDLKKELEAIGDRLADKSGWTEREEDEYEFKLNEVAEKIQRLAKEHGYESEDLVRHPSKYAVDGRLTNKYAGNVRGTFYPGGFLTATEDEVYDRDMPRLIADKKNHPHLANQPGFTNNDYFYCRWKDHIAPVANASLDHKTPVATHWNDGHGGSQGNNTHQLKRKEWYNLVTNLEPLCGPCNSSKGSGGVSCKPEVGPLFKGPEDP